MDRLVGTHPVQIRNVSHNYSLQHHYHYQNNIETYLYGVNYPDLPRSGLSVPRLLRTGLPASMSELTSNVDTSVPDSTGDFPSQEVRGDPLLPN